ncbi:MAG: helix-turn-helix transcriptional regulator [Eubacteriaceae bacterium]|nr:helix-turn-helix transcriptional regulator [Eubacteriaceae bacterium]
MDAIQENAKIGIPHKKSIEKSWLYAALLSFVGFYQQLADIPSYFTTLSGQPISHVLGFGYACAIIALLATPAIAKKRGVFSSLEKLRALCLTCCLSGCASFVLLTLCKTNAPLLSSVLVCICLGAPAAMAGVIIERAVQVISIKSAARFSGILVMAWLALFTVLMVFLGIFNFWIAFYISETIVYCAPFAASVAIMYANDDDGSYSGLSGASYFSDGLFKKFMACACLLLSLDMFSDGSYYTAGRTYSELFSMWVQVATFILPIASGVFITWLLHKNIWLSAMVGTALLKCFEQGLILFFNNPSKMDAGYGYALASAYALSSAFTSSAPLILSLFVPMVFCAQRRNSGLPVTCLLSFWLSGTVLNTLVVQISKNTFSVASIVNPATSFILSLAAIAFLFYLYAENNRLYVASLIEEYKRQDIEEIQETVSTADMYEGLGLTPREKEVCTLLLKSLTVRQVSAELGLAFATVNGYYRSLYRKLGINSKAELFMRFAGQIAM